MNITVTRQKNPRGRVTPERVTFQKKTFYQERYHFSRDEKVKQPSLFTKAAVSKEQQEKNVEKELEASRVRAAEQREKGPSTPIDQRSAGASTACSEVPLERQEGGGEESRAGDPELVGGSARFCALLCKRGARR